MKGILVADLIKNLEKLPEEFLLMSEDLMQILKECGDEYYYNRDKLDFVKMEKIKRH